LAAARLGCIAGLAIRLRLASFTKHPTVESASAWRRRPDPSGAAAAAIHAHAELVRGVGLVGLQLTKTTKAAPPTL
jgi:hypothetical protein